MATLYIAQQTKLFRHTRRAPKQWLCVYLIRPLIFRIEFDIFPQVPHAFNN